MAKKGERLSDECKQKISEALRGEKHPMFGKPSPKRGTHLSEEQKLKISRSSIGKKMSPETCLKMSRGLRGLKRTPETCARMSAAVTGRKLSEETRRKISENNGGRTFWRGRHHTEETRLKMSEAHKGEKSYLWKGGISFEPYCPRFNEKFRERVRAFFGYRCVICGISQLEALALFNERLSVHHVSFKKQACCEENEPVEDRFFVSLCKKHHSATNFNRDQWRERFTNLINSQFGGRCYL
jgi:hypothetical protein